LDAAAEAAGFALGSGEALTAAACSGPPRTIAKAIPITMLPRRFILTIFSPTCFGRGLAGNCMGRRGLALDIESGGYPGRDTYSDRGDKSGAGNAICRDFSRYPQYPNSRTDIPDPRHRDQSLQWGKPRNPRRPPTMNPFKTLLAEIRYRKRNFFSGLLGCGVSHLRGAGVLDVAPEWLGGDCRVLSGVFFGAPLLSALASYLPTIVSLTGC
jgi:hypothetical protein